MRRVSFVAFFLVAVAGFVAAGEDQDLAARCDAVKWVLPKPVDGVIVDPIPDGLKTIREELKKRGSSSMDDVEKSLDKRLHLRRIASDVVSTWPGDRSRKILLRLLKDADADAAASAAFGLGRVGGAEVVDPLVAALADARPRVRHDALNALGDIGGANKALEGAIRCLDAKEPWIRESAAQLLSLADVGADKAAAALEARMAKETDAEAKTYEEASLRVCRARVR